MGSTKSSRISVNFLQEPMLKNVESNKEIRETIWNNQRILYKFITYCWSQTQKNRRFINKLLKRIKISKLNSTTFGNHHGLDQGNGR